MLVLLHYILDFSVRFPDDLIVIILNFKCVAYIFIECPGWNWLFYTKIKKREIYKLLWRHEGLLYRYEIAKDCSIFIQCLGWNKVLIFVISD